jgi:hypothetical protein
VLLDALASEAMVWLKRPRSRIALFCRLIALFGYRAFVPCALAVHGESAMRMAA